MGILTNLLQLSWQQEDQRRQQEMAQWSELAQIPGIRPELRNAAIDNLIGMAPPKAKGLKDIGSLFKGLIGKQMGGANPAQQHMQEALASTGRPATSLPIPGGSQIPPQTTTMGGGPGGPTIGGQPVPAPPEIQTTRPGVNMSEMLPPSQSQVGPVRPSAMLSPQEQLNMKLEEVGRTAELQEQLRLQTEEGIEKIRNDARARADDRQFDTDMKRADLLIAAGKTPEQAWAIVGRPLPREAASELGGTFGEMARAQNIVDNPSKYPASTVKAAKEYIAKETKTGAEPGNLGERERAQDIVDHPDKHTPSQVKAAKDFLTKQNQQSATQVLINQAKYEPGTVQFMAAQYLVDRKQPSFSYGPAGALQRAQFWNEVSKQATAQGLTPQAAVARAAAVKAAEVSLTSTRRTLDAVVAFEATATANLDRAINRAQQTIDLGVIPLNHVFRGVARVFGSGPQATADAARMVAYNEVAKVLTSPGSNAALTETARAEANQVLNGDYTIPQLMDVARLLKQDMTTRKESLRNRMNQIRTDIMGGGEAGEAPGETPPPGGGPTPDAQKKAHDEAQKWLKEN